MNKTYNSQRGDYLVSTDTALLDKVLVHQYLSQESYWAQHIPFTTVERSIAHSLCFGVYQQQKQVGFARVITDHATFAYLADVFILPAHRKQGLAKWLMQCIMDHPGLQGLRSWLLTTTDAHALYRPFGFTVHPEPHKLMRRHQAGIYQDQRD